MIKTKTDTDYTPTVVLVYNVISRKYGYAARISDILDLLRTAFMLEEFEILDYSQMMNGPLQAFMIDVQRAWQKGDPVNFKEIYDAILKAGDFTGSEKRMFIDGKIEERLWGIILAVTSPGGYLELKTNE